MLRLRLLGALDLVGPDGARMDQALRRTKGAAVLAYLTAARPRGPQRRDKLAALFWPDLAEDRARAALRVTLTRLREEVGADVIQNRGADEIGVDGARLWCDVVALDDCVARGDAMGAADLYRGPFLDGVHVEGTAAELEQWISAERATIRTDVERALLRAADRAERDGAHGDAIAMLRRAVELAPESETLSRKLIELQLAAGDRGGALRAYESLTQALSSQFGVAPSPATTALVDRLERGAAPRRPTPATTVPARAAARDTRPSSRARWQYVVAGLAAGAVILLLGAALTRGSANASVDRAPVTWTMLRPVGTTMPRGRVGRAAILDSTGDAILVFGGNDYNEDPASSTLSSDLWRLRGVRAGEAPRWTKVNAAGAQVPGPAPRWLFGFTYDSGRDLAILHGGALGFTSPCANDTWVLEHASGMDAVSRWRRVITDGAVVPGRAGIVPVFDAASRKLIVFGGHDCVATFFNDVWVLTFSDTGLTRGRWDRLAVDTASGAPVGRSAYAAAYDAMRNRLFVYGGTYHGVVGELWVLEHTNGVGGVPRWRLLQCSGEARRRTGTSAVLDSAGNLLLFGGSDAENAHDDLLRVTGLQGSASACRWDALPAMGLKPNARAVASLLRDPRTGAVYLFGGEFGSTGFIDAWVLGGR